MEMSQQEWSNYTQKLQDKVITEQEFIALPDDEKALILIHMKALLEQSQEAIKIANERYNNAIKKVEHKF